MSMSRFRRVVHGVASGYVALVAASLYALAILPIGLHFLSAKEVGLWTLMAGIAAYLSQIDLGMSGSLARLLIDHKDDRQGDSYGSLIKTGWLVLTVQGMIVALVGVLLAPPLASLLQIEPGLQLEFISLMRWMTLSWALGFVTKIFGHLLQAHQRMDLVNYAQLWNLALGFILMWLLLYKGAGVMSQAWVTLLVSTFGNFILFVFCWRLRLFPSHGHWGSASWDQFKAIFKFGKEIFLVSVGAQLIIASQPMIITRQLGVAYATLWYAGTRVFNLVNQAIWRISDMSMPAFAEMMAHREDSLLRERYRGVVTISASLAALAGISCALCNSPFVWVWTSISKKAALHWPSHNDVLLAAWMIVLAILHCHNGLVIYMKRIRAMGYVYFAEGVAFIILALIAAPWLGLAGIIGSSVICSVFFSLFYGLRRIAGYFGMPLRGVALDWITPAGQVILLFAPLAAVSWFITKGLADHVVQLTVRMLVCLALGIPIFLRLGVPVNVQRELLNRAPRPINPLLRRVFLKVP